MISKFSLLATSASAASWNYATNGADWPNDFSACGLTNQSPIDLVSYDPEKEFPYKKYPSTDD